MRTLTGKIWLTIKTEDTKTPPKAHAHTYRNTASVRPSYVLVVSLIWTEKPPTLPGEYELTENLTLSLHGGHIDIQVFWDITPFWLVNTYVLKALHSSDFNSLSKDKA